MSKIIVSQSVNGVSYKMVLVPCNANFAQCNFWRKKTLTGPYLNFLDIWWPSRCAKIPFWAQIPTRSTLGAIWCTFSTVLGKLEKVHILHTSGKQQKCTLFTLLRKNYGAHLTQNWKKISVHTFHTFWKKSWQKIGVGGRGKGVKSPLIG